MPLEFTPLALKPPPIELPKKRKKSSTSPTQRSLKKLRDEGWTVAITEHWNSFCKMRQDLFGFVDLLCLRDGVTMAVQTTSGDNVSARINKIAEMPVLGLVRKAGWRIEVHGWRKLVSSGKWECRVIDIS